MIYTKRLKNSLGAHLRTTGICYYAIVLKEEKNKYKNWPLKKRLSKCILSNKQNLSDNIISEDMFLSEIQEIRWDFSMMKINFKLTKRTTKNEKFGLENGWKCIIS